VSVLKEVEIVLLMDLQERLQAIITGSFGRPDRAQNGIDTAQVLRSGVQLAVEDSAAGAWLRCLSSQKERIGAV